MPKSEAKIMLVDTLPFRREAYANQLNTWAKPNGFVIQEAAEMKSVAGDSVLALLVLGSQPVGSAEGRARIQTVMHSASGPVAVIVDNQTVECVNVALDFGLKGVLNTSEVPSVLFAALGFIIAGGCYVPHVRSSQRGPSEMPYLPQPDEEPSALLHTHRPVGSSNPDLTRRQNEVLYGLANGCSNKEIARDLEVAEATVKSHVRQVMRKLNVENRTQAALLARDFLNQQGVDGFSAETMPQ